MFESPNLNWRLVKNWVPERNLAGFLLGAFLEGLAGRPGQARPQKHTPKNKPGCLQVPNTNWHLMKKMSTFALMKSGILLRQSITAVGFDGEAPL
jgi:hypothetical protein